MNLSYRDWISDPSTEGSHPLARTSIEWKHPTFGDGGFFIDRHEHKKATQEGKLAFSPKEVARLCEAEVEGALDDAAAVNILRCKRKFRQAVVVRVIPRQRPQSDVLPEPSRSRVKRVSSEAILAEYLRIHDETIYSPHVAGYSLHEAQELAKRDHPSIVKQLDQSARDVDAAVARLRAQEGSISAVRRHLDLYAGAMWALCRLAVDPYAFC